MLKILLAGYLTGLAGFLSGTVLVVSAKKINRRFQGMILGFSAGILIALVSFEMLPEVFERHGVFAGIVGILLGTLVSALLERKAVHGSFALMLGIIIHGMPEGMGLGSILSYNYVAGLPMAAAIAIHCLPESMAVSLWQRKENARVRTMFLTPFLLAVPMGLGAAIGSLMGSSPGYFSSLCLAFAGGVLIYMCCGQILPEARDAWHGRLSTIGAALGFAAGIFLTAGLM